MIKNLCVPNRGTVVVCWLLVMLLSGFRGVEAELPMPEGVETEAWLRVQGQLEAQGVRPAFSKTGGDETEESARLFPEPHPIALWTQFGRVVAVDGDTMVIGGIDLQDNDEINFFNVYERSRMTFPRCLVHPLC